MIPVAYELGCKRECFKRFFKREVVSDAEAIIEEEFARKLRSR